MAPVKPQWANTEPMDSSGLMVKQAQELRAQNPHCRLWVCTCGRRSRFAASSHSYGKEQAHSFCLAFPARSSCNDQGFCRVLSNSCCAGRVLQTAIS